MWNPVEIAADLLKFYRVKLSDADPRVENWLMMQSYVPTLCVVGIYLIMATTGPRIMAYREPFNVQLPMLLYNLGIVVLSAYMFYEFTAGMITAGFDYRCDSVDYSNNPNALRLASVCWWYYFSKFIDFFDTLFFILRKKTKQVTFLHVYHHATMPTLWWIGVKWVPGGQSCPCAAINCFVHIIMYSYYFLSGLGPSVQKYLWWKKYVTVLQIVQFFVIFSQSFYAYYHDLPDCKYPRGIILANVIYQITLLSLFTHFFVNTYILRGSKDRLSSRVHSENITDGELTKSKQN